MCTQEKTRITEIIILIGVMFFIPTIYAAADFSVSSFSCTPSETAINEVFSCTAQVKNNGDAAGSVGTALLYPDSGDWLENSNYPQASGSSVNPGQTTEITFSGLRATISGNNGFSKITLDDVTDTYVADNNINQNIIDVVASVSNSVSSAAMNGNFDTTASVTAGGNIDVDLTFAVTSGGCTIGNQDNPKTITDMSDGNIQSRSWSVTMGTSGNCQFTITASATGTGGVATKDDSVSSTVTCTNCPTGGSSGSSSSGGGGGAGAGVTIKTLGELPSIYESDLAAGENMAFNFSAVKHYLSVINLTDTTAKIIVESTKQTFDLTVGDLINVDLTDDALAEFSIRLQSINIITKKAKFVLTRLTESVIADKSIENEGREQTIDKKEEETKKETIEKKNVNSFIVYILLGIGIGIIILVVIIFFVMSRKKFHWSYRY